LNLFTSWSCQNSSLNSSTISNGFIRVNWFIWFFSIEEFLDKLLNFWNSSWSTDKDNFMNVALWQAWIVKDFLYWRNTFLEIWHAEFFEFSSCDCSIIINAFHQRINFNCGLSTWGQSSFGSFSLCSESSHGSWVISDIKLGLL